MYKIGSYRNALVASYIWPKLLKDYYPFGSSLPTRSWSDVSRAYRYGFNDKEKDFETTTDAYNFGARIYDGRLGRWMSVDPLMSLFPFESGLVFTSDNPIIYIDYNGKSKYITSIHIDVDANGKEISRTTVITYINDEDLIVKEISLASTFMGITVSDYTNYYDYYDVNEIHTTVWGPNGKIISQKKEVKRGAYRYRSAINSNAWANTFMTKSYDDKQFSKGLHGIKWTTSGGEGEGNSHNTPNSKFMRSDNIDMFLSLLGISKPAREGSGINLRLKISNLKILLEKISASVTTLEISKVILKIYGDEQKKLQYNCKYCKKTIQPNPNSDDKYHNGDTVQHNPKAPEKAP